MAFTLLSGVFHLPIFSPMDLDFWSFTPWVYQWTANLFMYHLAYFFFLSEMPHLQHGKQQQTRTLMHCSLKKFRDLTFDNVCCVHFFFFLQIKKKKWQNKKFRGCGTSKSFLFAKACENRRFCFPCTSNFTWFSLFRKKGRFVVWSADG